jgi:ADP-ribose pyrophosphatase
MSTDDEAEHPRFPPWRVVGRREVFSVPGKISVSVERVELPDGRLVDDYWQIKLADFVVVFAETGAGEVVCLRQYRHGPRRESLELVAGRIDGGDAPLATARRELLEETGYVSEHWEALGTFTVSATQGIATAYLFRARRAVKRQQPCSGDLEEAAVELLTRDQLVAAMRRGEVVTGSHLAALAVALLTDEKRETAGTALSSMSVVKSL